MRDGSSSLPPNPRSGSKPPATRDDQSEPRCRVVEQIEPNRHAKRGWVGVDPAALRVLSREVPIVGSVCGRALTIVDNRGSPRSNERDFRRGSVPRISFDPSWRCEASVGSRRPTASSGRRPRRRMEHVARHDDSRSVSALPRRCRNSRRCRGAASCLRSNPAPATRRSTMRSQRSIARA